MALRSREMPRDPDRVKTPRAQVIGDGAPDQAGGAEHDNASLKEATSKVISAAQKIGGDVDVLVAGSNAGAVAAVAAKLAGVRKVLQADGPALAQQSAESLDALITPLMANYDALLFAASTTGKNAAPRIAAKLDVMQLSGVTAVENATTFVRPIYAGNAMITVTSAQPKNVLVVQATAFKAVAEGGSAVLPASAMVPRHTSPTGVKPAIGS